MTVEMKKRIEMHDVVGLIAPIHGIRFVDTNDKNTWVINFKPEATQEQKDAAYVALRSEDFIIQN